MRKLNVLWILPAAALLVSGCGKSRTNSDFIVNPTDADGSVTSPQVTDDSAAEDVTPAKKAESANGSNAARMTMEEFEYTVREDGTACIVKYNGQDANVVITSQIDGTPVTEIGQYAFEAAGTVETIEIPAGVTKIGEFAFMDCGNLRSVNIPDGVTTLYRGTFAGCTALTEMTIPAGVTETNEELFTGCGLVDLYVKNPSLEYMNWGLEEMENKCVIHASAGSPVLSWAQNNGFPTAAE